MPPIGIRGRLLLAVLMLMRSGAASAPRAQGPAAVDGYEGRIAALLDGADADPRVHAKKVAALHDLGPGALPALLECLAAGLPRSDPGAPPQPLDTPRRALVLQALVLHPRSELCACLARLSPDPSTKELRVAGLEVLAEVAQDGDLELLLELAWVPAETSPRDPLLLALRESVRRLLGRDSRAFVSLQNLIPEAAPEHQAHLLRALAEAGGERALRALSHLLDFAPRLAGQILREIAIAAERGVPPYGEDVLKSVRQLLLGEDEGLRRDAALALGPLQDFDSIPVLIDCLETGGAGVHDAALWSLRTMTGLRFADSQARWLSWHAQETRWWSEEYPRLVEALRSEDVAAAADGIRRLALHRLFRHEIARDLAEVVRHPRPELRLLAVNGLAEVGSRGSAPELMDALEDPEVPVRAAACAALRDLFASELPCERQAWIEELGPLAERDP